MSRALEKDILNAVGSGQPSTAYEALSTALTQGLDRDYGELLEIEILGRSHVLEPGTFLLREGNALAVSKLGLVQAFFAARVLLRRHHSGDGAALSEEQLLGVTSVILLMDPEHLTAANTRKTLICSGKGSGAPGLIRKDKFFIDSLLTSRLHRHTKSPTLWSHRRWLIEAGYRHGIQVELVTDLRHIVSVAGERHPRNYYAWCHARWLTGRVAPDLEDRSLRDAVDVIKGWCFRNHTDVSGWSFLSFLLSRLDGADTSAVLRETCKFAVSFRWTNESTWVFLRTLAASGNAGERELTLFQETLDTCWTKTEGIRDRQVLENAKSWTETYRR